MNGPQPGNGLPVSRLKRSTLLVADGAMGYAEAVPLLPAGDRAHARPTRRHRSTHPPPPPTADPAAPTLPPEGPTAPPRTADPAAETLPPSDAAGVVPTPPPLPSPPGYEILGELGRGGMGVVYKARQLGFNRIVAVKMILAGSYAGDDERERFRIETQAVARLLHPNIVQVHEVGEHEGRPFFSMEFCPGGALDRKLNATPLPPQEAAALVETLARAMQSAHQKGVIHRDLKPANVLLAEDGTPKITDFGLAKRLDEEGLTASGAVMGTPSYMAPEQAGGRSKDIGPACDVYALGAILYECLTGRPPFKAASALETLRQVVADEPAPPRRLQSRTPHDLETICLKCLEKQPSRRCGTAAELAEDLRRFLDGEPVRARPVAGWERGWKWMRRHPTKAAAAGLLLAFVIALLAGGALSAYLAVEANANFLDARRREKDANDALAKLGERDKQISADNAELEETVARGLLRPIGHDANKVTDPEIEALWELADNKNERVHLLFVQQALQGPGTARQLLNRADMAVHAAVGLDPERRRQVEKALLAQLRDEKSDFAVRTDCVLIGLTLDEWSPEFASAAAHQAVEAMGKTTNGYALRDLAEAVAVLAPRMESGETARQTSATVRQIQESLGKTPDTDARGALAQAVAALAPRMGPGNASAAARWVIEAMGKTTNPFPLRELAAAVGELAPRMGPGEASAAAQQILEAMGKATDFHTLGTLGGAVAALAPWMEPGEAVRQTSAAARQAVEAMRKTSDRWALSDLAKAVAALAPWMEPGEAARQTSAAAGQAVGAMWLETFSLDLGNEADALAALAPRMEPGEASAYAGQAVWTMGRTTDPVALGELARAVAALAPWMVPGEASATARPAVEAMRKTTDPESMGYLAGAVAALVPRMEPGEAGRQAPAAARRAAEAMGNTTNPAVLRLLAEPLAALIVKVEPEDTSRGISSLACAVGDSGTPPTLLAALAPLAEASRPLPGRFTDQQLVDLLKMPTCQQPAREVIVRQLGWQCNQHFDTMWDFVDWAKKNRPNLDLISPPVRPTAVAP